MTFRIVNDEGDPAHAEARKRIKAMLQDALDRVDEENITSLCMVGVMANSGCYSGRVVTDGPYTLVGLLEFEKLVIVGMIDEQLAGEIEGE